MNDHGLDDEAFGVSKGGIVSSFDAFRKSLKLEFKNGSLRVEETVGCGRRCSELRGTLALGSLATRRTSLTFDSQNQEDVSRPRPQFLGMDGDAHPHVHISLLV